MRPNKGTAGLTKRTSKMTPRGHLSRPLKILNEEVKRATPWVNVNITWQRGWSVVPSPHHVEGGQWMTMMRYLDTPNFKLQPKRDPTKTYVVFHPQSMHVCNTPRTCYSQRLMTLQKFKVLYYMLAFYSMCFLIINGPPFQFTLASKI